jgi:chromate reductase
MAQPPSILAFAGSVRAESLNRKFLQVAVDAARAAGAEVTLISLKDYPLPLYNGDEEEAGGLPANARKLVDLINGHAGLLIASPEYNAQPTPLLKNTLDWCTRADDDPFPGRVAAVIAASPSALGGINALKVTQQLLLHLGCHVIPGYARLPQAHQAFGPDGKLTDPRAHKNVQEVAARLVDTVRRFG